MIDRNKRRRGLHLTLALAMMVAPIAHATEGEKIQLAAAIGGETKPPPLQKKTPPKTPPTVPAPSAPAPSTPAPSAPTDVSADPSSEGLNTSTWIWIGVGAAALLAALGGGGGGGGSSSQH